MKSISVYKVTKQKNINCHRNLYLDSKDTYMEIFTISEKKKVNGFTVNLYVSYFTFVDLSYLNLFDSRKVTNILTRG